MGQHHHGRRLIRKVCGDEVWGFTTPLIVKPDGTKYGKTETGTVWLDPERTSPFAMYQFFVNTPDEQVGELLRFLTFLDHDEITELDRDGGAPAAARGPAGAGPGRRRTGARRGRGGQVRGGLGRALQRGDRRPQRGDAARRDRGRADDRRARAELLDGLTLVDVLERTGLAKSKKDARRTIEQGGAYVNNVRQTDDGRTFAAADLLHDRYLVLRKGRREVHIVQAT